ncbi:MAG: hypothetical protein ACRYGP_08675, partial [Janthinobacterium lividum]
MEIADRDLQLMLIELGEDLGGTGPSGRGDDGDWGRQSDEALLRTLNRLEGKYPMPATLDSISLTTSQVQGIIDISDLSTIHPGMLNPSNITAFVWHHTGGRGDAKQVVDVLNRRKLNVQYILDREGQLFAAAKYLSLCYHAGKADREPWLTRLRGPHANAYTLGCEVIAKDDTDVLTIEVQRAIRLAVELHKSFPDIYHIGHGELSSNKEA